MRFAGLDLNLLVALDTLLEDRNVTAAAHRMNLSQSAMSSALGRLREYFKDELLVPSGRGLLPTPRALMLERPVREVLLGVRALVSAQPEFTAETSTRNLRIMVSDYAASVGLDAALADMAARAPHLTFDLLHIDVDADERLGRGDVDLLLTLDRYVSPAHPSALLFEDEFVVAGWAGNPDLPPDLDAEAYAALGHVAVRLGPHAPAFEAASLPAGLVRRVEVWAPSFALAPRLLVGTRRIATLQRRLAEAAARSLPLVLRPAPFPIPRARQVVQWRAGADADPALVWVRDRLVAAFDDRPSERADIDAVDGDHRSHAFPAGAGTG